MLTYTVHESPNPESDRIDRADGLEFVKDGFSWLTAIFPPIGFLASRLWIPAVLYCVVVGALTWLLQALKVDQTSTGILVTALNVFLAYEHSTIKRWDLDHKGWHMIGVVNGKSLDDCERRFLEAWLPEQPVISAAPGRSDRTGSKSTPYALWPFGAKA